MTPAPSHGDRARRAAHLAGERPHAAEILSFYGRVLALQEAVARASAEADWLRHARSLEDFAWPSLAEGFRRFASGMAAATPEASRGVGERLAAAPAQQLEQTLERVARREPLAAVAAALETEAAHVELFGRAFLQPWAEALARSRADATVAAGDGAAALCPACSWPPQVSVLADDGGTLGGRSLICALCGGGWSFARVRCAHCGEQKAEHLVLHEVDGLNHLRIEECTSCGRYLKRIDLRQLGGAVPVVEDLATPELDLWARERGLEKVCRNLVAI